MADREEDLKIGVRSTAVWLGEMDRAFLAALQLLLIVTLVLVGRNAELGFWYYAGLAMAAVLSAYPQYLVKERERARCFRAFLNNAWLGGAIFAGIVLDSVLQP